MVDWVGFIPRHFPRTRLASGRGLSASQQYQYDVLRTVGGKLVRGKDGCWRRADTTEKIFGLNFTAMFKLVEFGLVECVDNRIDRGLLFVVSALAKDEPGTRYIQVNQIIKELPS